MRYEANVFLSEGVRHLREWPEGAPIPKEGQSVWIEGERYEVLRVEYVFGHRNSFLDVDIMVKAVEE